MKIEEISNEKLLELCTHWGRQALFARNKFIALLPEVNKRRLFVKKGFKSIYEFAFRLAGLSEAQVDSVVRLEKRLAPNSEVRQLLMNGTVSVSKVEKIVSVLNAENDSVVAAKLEVLPRKALETWVRDQKSLPGNNLMQQQVVVVKSPKLSEEVQRRLSELQEKNIDIDSIILEALARMSREIAEEKQKLAEIAKEKMIDQITQEKVISRAAPVAIRRLLKKEHGTKCAVPTCNKSSQEIHHADRFALSQIHDPHYMAPLCRQHHQIAHSIDVKVTEKRQH